MDLAERWGCARDLWDRPWGSLSGGEAQRLSLAIPYGLNCAEVLLLDGAMQYIYYIRIQTRVKSV